MNETTSINERNLKELLDAFEHYFPTDTVYVSDKPFKSFYGDYNWRSRKDFIDFIKRLTGVEIKNEKDVANIKLAQNKLVKISSESPKEKQIDETTPDETLRSQQEEERQKRESEIEKTKQNAETLVKNTIRKKLELYKQSEKYRKTLEGKTITVSPRGNFTEVILTKEDKEKIFNYAQASKDKENFQILIEQELKKAVDQSPESTKQNIDPSVIHKTATDLSDKLETFSGLKNSNEIPDKIYVCNNSSPIIALTDPDNPKLKNIIPDDELRTQIAESAKAVSISIDQENSVHRDITQPLFENENISSLFYPKNIANFEISEKQDDQESKDNGVDISLRDVYDNGKDIWEMWNKLFNKEITIEEIFSNGYVTSKIPLLPKGISFETKAGSILVGSLPSTIGAVSGISTSMLAKQWLLSGAPASLSQLTTGTKILSLPETAGLGLTVSQSLSLATPSIASVTGKLLFVPGINSVGVIVGKGIMTNGVKFVAAGINIGQSSLGIVAGGTGLKVVASGFIGKALAFLGGLGGPVGLAVGVVVGFIFGKLLEKIPWDKIGKFLKEWGGVIGAGMLLGGGLLTSIPLIATGSLFLIAGLGAARSPAVFLAGILIALKAILKPPALQIGKALIIIFIVIPIIVALFMFIINSGAYVVPPTVGIMGDTSPYIGIVKTPLPAGPFENTDLPKTITYEVVITAKKGPLTNVKIGYDCVVISSSKSNCPAITEIPTFVESISPSNPFTFTYTSTYDGAYSDSSIIDTITVTADTSLQSGVIADGGASVTFGTPPISCPLPEGQPLNDMNYSYSANDTGHGSTKYWKMMGNPYHYNLPQHSGCTYPTDCPYYGYAYDVFPTTSIKTVYVPTVLGKETTWTLSGSFTNPNAGYSLVYTDTTGNYTITLTHLNSPSGPKTAKSGTAVNTLFDQGGNTHLHIEFQMNGIWEKPELYFCQ